MLINTIIIIVMSIVSASSPLSLRQNAERHLNCSQCKVNVKMCPSLSVHACGDVRCADCPQCPCPETTPNFGASLTSDILAVFPYTMYCKSIVRGGQAVKAHFETCFSCLKCCMVSSTTSYELRLKTLSAAADAEVGEHRRVMSKLGTELACTEQKLISANKTSQALIKELETTRSALRTERRVAAGSTIKTAIVRHHFQGILIRELRTHKDQTFKMIEELAKRSPRKRRRICDDEDTESDEYFNGIKQE